MLKPTSTEWLWLCYSSCSR